jgi:hypothetical protein
MRRLFTAACALMMLGVGFTASAVSTNPNAPDYCPYSCQLKIGLCDSGQHDGMCLPAATCRATYPGCQEL